MQLVAVVCSYIVSGRQYLFASLQRLCLDIKVKEPDFKELVKGRTVYLPPRFMTCNQAIDELLEVEEKKGKGGMN